MRFNVLHAGHVMVGVDIPDGMTIPADPPKPMPHYVGAPLAWQLPPTQTSNVLGQGGQKIIHKGSDIGMLIPHASPNLLLAIIIAASGSKSHFGPAAVHINGKSPAAAVAGYVNFNLNCGGATLPPLPSGLVVAPTTIHVGMTWGDLLGGMCSAIADSAIQYCLDNCFGDRAETFVHRFKVRLMGPITRRILPNAPRFVSVRTALLLSPSRFLSQPIVGATLHELPETAARFLLGSPLGSSLGSATGVPWLSPVAETSNLLSGGAGSLGQGLGDLIDPPSVEQFP
jgi:hypothetical protein